MPTQTCLHDFQHWANHPMFPFLQRDLLSNLCFRETNSMISLPLANLRSLLLVASFCPYQCPSHNKAHPVPALHPKFFPFYLNL